MTKNSKKVKFKYGTIDIDTQSYPHHFEATGCWTRARITPEGINGAAGMLGPQILVKSQRVGSVLPARSRVPRS